MKRLTIFAIFLSELFLVGCGTSQKMAENKQSADQFFATGNYGEALSVYKQIIQVYEVNNNSALCPVYTNAAISAINVGESTLGLDYLKKAVNTQFATEETYLSLANVYANNDNLSLEMLALEDVVNKYPESGNIENVKSRLFKIYVESDNYEKALKIWNNKDVNDIEDVNILKTYFILNQGIGDDLQCEETAKRMLEVDPENITALSYFGKKYYRKAEDLYQKEMNAYDENKTNKQYKILLNALDQVTADFKKSLGYFTKLYKVDPTPNTANYLSCIYNRLSDKEKAAYYKKLAEKK